MSSQEQWLEMQRRLIDEMNAREFLNRPSLREARERAWAREADGLLARIAEAQELKQ